MDTHRPGGSHYLTPAAVRRGVALAAPMLESALADPGVVGSGVLYLVIMDPGCPPDEYNFEEAVLYERAFGDRGSWDADYAALARAKAKLSWRTGLDGSVLQDSRPHLLRDGDTVYRTWHSNGRGTEQLSHSFALIDVLPYGRQEVWQDSPEGWPQSPTYSRWSGSEEIAAAYGEG